MEKPDLLDMTVKDFAGATAAKRPTPGGGSVAGVVGALAAALGEMSLAFTRGKPRFAEHAAEHKHLARRLAVTRGMFLDLVADDAAAYELFRQTKGAGEEGQVATAVAIDVPREMTKLALALLEDLRGFLPTSNRRLVSDLVAGAALAEAVVRISDANVRVNAPGVTDEAGAKEVVESSAADLEKAAALLAEIAAAAFSAEQ